MPTTTGSSATHAARHKTGGADHLVPPDIGAATANQAWQPNTAYVVGQLVVQAATLYECTIAHTSGASFVGTDWTAISGGSGAVASVNGHTGVVVLGASDVGADASGAAATAQANAIAASDPAGSAATAQTAAIATSETFATNALATALAGLAPAEFPAAAQGSGLTHSGIGQVINGVTITAGMRVLDTATGVSSGLWVAASGAWTRPVDFATGSNAQGKLVDVDAGGLWLCISNAVVTVDTTSQVWQQIDASVIQAGTGLSKTGTTLSLALTKALITATGLTFSDVAAAAALTPTSIKTASYTAVVNDLGKFDVSGGSISQPLPNAPADKSFYAAKVVALAGTNTLSLTCQGSDVLNIAGGATTYPVKMLNQAVLLQYQASGAIWNILADDLPLGQLDLRYDSLGQSVIVVLGTPATGQTASPYTANPGDVVEAYPGTTINLPATMGVLRKAEVVATAPIVAAVAAGTAPVNLPQSTINVASTAGYPASGTIYIAAASLFTTIAAPSNGAALPQATINVAATAGFPSTAPMLVVSSAGVQTVTYTGSSGTTFTGCTGGTGTLATGNLVFIQTGPLVAVNYTGLTPTSFTGCTGGAGVLNAGQAITPPSGPVTVKPLSFGSGYQMTGYPTGINLPNAGDSCLVKALSASYGVIAN